MEEARKGRSFFTLDGRDSNSSEGSTQRRGCDAYPLRCSSSRLAAWLEIYFHSGLRIEPGPAIISYRPFVYAICRGMVTEESDSPIYSCMRRKTWSVTVVKASRGRYVSITTVCSLLLALAEKPLDDH